MLYPCVSTETPSTFSSPTKPEPARAAIARPSYSESLTAPRAASMAGGASTTMSAPVSRARLEELLQNWARWCHGSLFPRQGVTFELDYKAPGEGAQDERRQPKPMPPIDHEGIMIERLIIKMPETHRKVLRVEYALVRRRRGETSDQLHDRKRRKLHMPSWQYLDHLAQAERMLINLLHRHMPDRRG